MAVYAVVNIRVTDPDRYAKYREKAPATITRYGGKYLARGGAVEVLEGDWDPVGTHTLSEHILSEGGRTTCSLSGQGTIDTIPTWAMGPAFRS